MSSSTKQHDGHIHDFGIVLHIALVLDVLDHRDEDAPVALPQEDSFNVGLWPTRDEVFYFAVIVSQNHHRNIEPGLLHLGCQFGGVHVANLQIGDDQVEARLRSREFQRLAAAGDMRNSGNILQMKVERLFQQQLVQSPVFAQNERVVQAGNEQDVVHAEGHEILEAFEEVLRARSLRGCMCRHG